MYRILTIGLEEARRVVEAAIEKASEMPEMPMTVAVVDRAGDPVYLVRQDGANSLTVRMAINKARTAVMLKMDTKAARTELAGEGLSIGEFIDPLMTTIPGGICLRTADGIVVGAIGTSGRRPPAKVRDQEVAEVGARAFQEMQGN
jgi:uncharacterized protein GlcG (DUF336 family)